MIIINCIRKTKSLTKIYISIPIIYCRAPQRATTQRPRPPPTTQRPRPTTRRATTRRPPPTQRQSQLRGSCPSNFQSLGNSCYFVSNDRVGWIEARKMCELLGARLIRYKAVIGIRVFQENGSLFISPQELILH